jgi:uncharacterized protein with von Willebrand factor type A (vWA) domain
MKEINSNLMITEASFNSIINPCDSCVVNVSTQNIIAKRLRVVKGPDGSWLIDWKSHSMMIELTPALREEMEKAFFPAFLKVHVEHLQQEEVRDLKGQILTIERQIMNLFNDIADLRDDTIPALQRKIDSITNQLQRSFVEQSTISNPNRHIEGPLKADLRAAKEDMENESMRLNSLVEAKQSLEDSLKQLQGRLALLQNNN